MKTPRELLLNRHRNVEPWLNTLRHDIVQSMGEPANERSHDAGDIGFLGRCWLELFVTCRGYWMGLGAAWVLVAVFVSAGALTDGNGRQMARAGESAAELMQAQLQLRNELLGEVVIKEARVVRPEPEPRSDIFREERYV